MPYNNSMDISAFFYKSCFLKELPLNFLVKFSIHLFTMCAACIVNLVLFQVKVKVTLRPTVSRPVRLGVRRPTGTRDQFFSLLGISFRQLRGCYFVAPSLTRGRVWRSPQYIMLVTDLALFSQPLLPSPFCFQFSNSNSGGRHSFANIITFHIPRKGTLNVSLTACFVP
jgi:hypothetical protein